MSVDVSKRDLLLDNEIKIQSYLESLGLADCNPVSEPITKEIVRQLSQNQKAERFESPERQLYRRP